MTGWWETYGCGCVSPDVKRKGDLLGYCPEHGADRTAVYHGMVPADNETRRVHRASLKDQPDRKAEGGRAS